ncbi:hypothetical protein ACROYT_G035084 [Oculina patagonica]
MQQFSRWNKGFRYLLMVLDVFSKYGWIVPLKDKKGETVTQAFKTIFKEGRKPQYLWTDKGKEYYNKNMKELLEKNGIALYSTENEEKSSVCERWNRTIKTRMWKQFTAQDLNNEDIQGSFYEPELLKAKQDVFRIDKVVRRDYKKKQALVKWKGPVAQKLFSDSFILLELFPVEPVRSNIDYLPQESDLYFAVEKCSDGAFPRSVSFGVLSPRVKCTVWSVTVYTSDPCLYEAHLLYQFKRACEVIDDEFVFRAIQDKSLTDHGRRVLQKRLPVQLDEEISVEVHENKFLQ